MGFQLIAIGDNDVQYPLQIIKGSPVTADFNFKDIRDLKSKGSHTYNFRLPSTPENEEYFGHYFMVGSYHTDANNSYNPFARRECFILQDTIEILRGFIQLSNVYLRENNRYEYECIVYSSEVNFLDSLKGLKFRQLNFSEWNHDLTANNVYDSYNSSSIDSGNLVWSLWDYGLGIASNQYSDYFAPPIGDFFGWEGTGINIQRLRPQVRVKALIDKIMNYTGYTYTSTFLDSALFNKIYCDLNYDKRDVVSTDIPAQTYYVKSKNTGTQQITLGDSWEENLLTAPTEVSDESASWSTASGGGFSYSQWDVQVGGFYAVTIAGTITPSSTIDNSALGFKIWENPNWATYPYQADNAVGGQFYMEVGDGGAFSVSINTTFQSDSMYAFGFWSGVQNNGITLDITNLNITIQPNSISDETEQVYINSLIGGLSVEKWFKSIMTKFNLVVVPNKADATNLIIEPYDDYVNTGRTVDWSDKIDFTKDVQIIPPTKFCGKQVEFKDTKGNDYLSKAMAYNPQNSDEFAYGGYIEPGVQNQFAEKNTEFTSIFTPTINYPLNGGSLDLGVYSCAVFNVSENGEKQNAGGMRLSFFHGVKALPTSSSYKLNFNGDELGTERTNYPFFSEYSEMDFATNDTAFSINWHTGSVIAPQNWDALPIKGLAIQYWRNYILDNFNVNSRMLSCNMRLSAKDISDFHFKDIITVNGQNYKVNSIKGYPISSTGNCRVELLATFKGISIPSGTNGEQMECDFIVVGWDEATGVGSFESLTTGLSATPDEDCCEGLGYYWYDNKCFNSHPDGGGSEPPNPNQEIGIVGGTDQNDNIYVFDFIEHTTVHGHNNTVVKPVKSKVVGHNNTLNDRNRNIDIRGNGNEVGSNVSNTMIDGDDNQLDTYSENLERWGEKIVFDTTLQGVSVTGSHARVMIDGDRVQSVYRGGTPKGTSQIGNFILNFRTDGSESVNRIGQYGLYTIDSLYNSIANINAFRFAHKSNIKIKTELIGVSEDDVNLVYKERAIINSTHILSCYEQPIVLSSSVDSSDISTAMGTITISPFSTLKIPYVKRLTGGGIGFKLEIHTYRKAINWSLKVTYETTPLITLSNGILKSPVDISGCQLWLDAANHNSFTLDGSKVTQWNDISGGNNHVLQANSTYKPNWKPDDWDRPYVDFDGSTANLNNEDAELLALADGNNTFIACYQSDITTSEYYGQVIMGCIQSSYTPRVGLRVNANALGGAGSDSVAYSSQNASTNTNACQISSAGVTNLSIVIGRRDGTTVKIWDGNGNTDTGTTGADNTSVTDFCVGGASSSGTTDAYEFNGKIHELICYNVAITDAEVDKVITYLKNKWNII